MWCSEIGDGLGMLEVSPFLPILVRFGQKDAENVSLHRHAVVGGSSLMLQTISWICPIAIDSALERSTLHLFVFCFMECGSCVELGSWRRSHLQCDTTPLGGMYQGGCDTRDEGSCVCRWHAWDWEVNLHCVPDSHCIRELPLGVWIEE